MIISGTNFGNIKLKLPINNPNDCGTFKKQSINKNLYVECRVMHLFFIVILNMYKE